MNAEAATKVLADSKDFDGAIAQIVQIDTGMCWLVVSGTTIVTAAYSMNEARTLAKFVTGPAVVKNVHTGSVVFSKAA